MRTIAKLTMLLRGRVALPDNFKLATEEFQEGWTFVQSGDTHWLDKELRTRGWHFMWIGEGSLRGGVGQTSQEAIAGALKLALRRLSERFNAAGVESIQVTKYPWFVVAKVKVYPYQIQQGTIVSASDGATTLTVSPPAKELAIPSRQVAPCGLSRFS
jgi:hypothetical protein